jgi:hypothetical protein
MPTMNAAVPSLVADLEGLGVLGGEECFCGVRVVTGVEALEGGPAGDEAKADGACFVKDIGGFFVAVFIAEFDDEVLSWVERVANWFDFISVRKAKSLF